MKLAAARICWTIGIYEETPRFRKVTKTPKKRKKDAASMLIAKMAVVSISPGGVPLNSHGAGGATGRRLLITTRPLTPDLAPAPAFAPALAPATPPHAPYPPVTLVLPPRRGRSTHNLGMSSPSTTSATTIVTLHPVLDCSSAEKGDGGETRAIIVIPKAAGFDTSEIGAPKLMASVGAAFNSFFLGEANKNGDQMDIDDASEELIEFSNNSPGQNKGRTTKTSHMFGFCDEGAVKTDKVKVMLKVKDPARKTRTAKKRGVMNEKSPEKSPNNNSDK
eukprot:scaffold78230_cov61-Attheya_sp.AAC.2